VARDAAIERKVVESYFGILEDLLLGVRIPAFTRKAKRRLIQHPKFYFFDAGIFRTIRPSGPLDSESEIEGAALETLFFQELCALNDYDHLDYKIYFWRTSNQTEVDFIIYGPRGLRAFEIKRARKYSQKDLTGLRAFLKDFPQAKAYFLYGGNDVLWEDKIQCLPFTKALAELRKMID
jgi:predicted AAA+ superfamily ATPase